MLEVCNLIVPVSTLLLFLHFISPVCAFVFPTEINGQLVNYFNINMAFQWGQWWQDRLSPQFEECKECHTTHRGFRPSWIRIFSLYLIFSNCPLLWGVQYLCLSTDVYAKLGISDTTVSKISTLIFVCITHYSNIKLQLIYNLIQTTSLELACYDTAKIFYYFG